MKKIYFIFVLLCISNLIFAAFPVAELMPDPNKGLYKKLGYFMGMFMLIFGVVIAYAYDNKIMVKAAWKGFLTVVIFFILYVATLFIMYNFVPEASDNFMD